MQMRVMGRRRAPRMQDGETADARAEAAWGRRQRRHRCRSGPEQDRMDEPFVLECDRGDRLGQREDDVETANRQKLGLARFEPGDAGRPRAPWAMSVAAGIASDPRRAAIVTGLDMPAGCGGAAGADRTHHPRLDPAEAALAALAQDCQKMQEAGLVQSDAIAFDDLMNSSDGPSRSGQ